LYVIFDVKRDDAQRGWTLCLQEIWLVWSNKDTWFLDHDEMTDTSFAGDGGTADDVPMSSLDASIGFLDPAQAKG